MQLREEKLKNKLLFIGVSSFRGSILHSWASSIQNQVETQSPMANPTNPRRVVNTRVQPLSSGGKGLLAQQDSPDTRVDKVKLYTSNAV